MKVAIYSRWPLAAAPLELKKALTKYTNVEASLVQNTDHYPDGRVFPSQYLTGFFEGTEAKKAMEEADLWHINNGMDPRLNSVLNGHRVLAQFHSLPRNGGWEKLWNMTKSKYTIRQPLHVREYKLPSLPNIIDPDEYVPTKRGKKIRIAFAPSSKAPVGMPNSKGEAPVKVILANVARKRDVEIVIIQGVPYKHNLNLKRESHILVDDVVTGNWHRTSLEGATFGCVVVNKNPSIPWYQAGLIDLEEKLLWLIDHPKDREALQEETRRWVVEEWHAMDLVKEYVEAYEKALR